jgi:hypothetical protein
MGGKSPLAGEFGAGSQPSGENITPDAPVKGLVKGNAGGFLQFIS